MPAKQQAPPPPTGFTGEVKAPTPAEQFGAWCRKRRAEHMSRPKGPLININTGGSGQRGGPRRHTTSRRRRRPPKRGTLFALLTVTFAAITVAATVVEFVAWGTATELFTLAEFISAGTAWCFGEPSAPKPPSPKPPRKPRQPAAQQGSGGHKCGAPTQDGSTCQRPVKAAGERCFDHPGGQAKPGTSTNGSAPKKTAGPRRTKKAAPAPSTPSTQSGA